MTLLEALHPSLHCESIDRAVERTLRGLSTRIPGETDSLPALLTAMTLHEADARGIERIVAIASNRTEAEALHDDLMSLCPDQVFLCPQREAFPGDSAGAPPNERSERAIALERLFASKSANGGAVVVVVPAVVLLEGIAEPKPPLVFKIGDLLDPEELSEQLVNAGFERETMVSEPEEFARRGGIFDLFGWGEQRFLRIELDDIEIVSLRWVDADTQRSVEEVQTAKVRIHSPITSDNSFILNQLSPQTTRVVVADAAGVSFAWRDWHRAVIERPEIEHAPYLPAKDAVAAMGRFGKLQFSTFKKDELSSEENEEENKQENTAAGLPRLPDSEEVTIPIKRQPLEEFRGDLNLFEGAFRRLKAQSWNAFLLCDSERQRERLYDLFDEHEDTALTELPILVPSLHRGFSIAEAKLMLFTEHQLFGRTRRRGRHRKFLPTGEAKRQLEGMRRGDHVVHVDHGVGRFDGIERIKVADSEQDCFKIGFYGGVSVYVRMEQFSKLQPYRAEDGEPALSKIGGAEWTNLRTKARKMAGDMAKQILELYATRAVVERPPATPDGASQHEFEAAFEFEDTPDQMTATEEIKQDLEAPNPMDRLLIGDVGFGKTEVAMRAVWKMLQEGKQAGVVCPTTVLAAQHGVTFRDRFRYTGANIEVLSRFTSPKDTKRILEETRQGKVDILIGTHRILSKDVQFRKLGVVIVDEEHKFGVKQKDDLRRKRTEVDVLSLSATPIPRTLQMALSGARDVSYIRTAPADRLPIETEVAPFDDRLIREAILRETSRGGQVFFVHNRIETMPQIKMRLEQIVPEIKIAMGHAKLPAHELERIMLDFMTGRYHVLLSSMIVESGIDMPNVNTLIVNRADTLGLAQLYQLRGRIGRSNRQAYAWLLTPPQLTVTQNARKRLRTLQEFNALGAGYNVALRDLELRGAGNLLGKEQSGMIAAIGFDLYLEMLEEAIQALREGQDPDTIELAKEEAPVRIELPGEALLPQEYIETVFERVEVYRRLEEARDITEVEEIRAEMRDRYGKLPDAVQRLLLVVSLRVEAKRTGIRHISIQEREARLDAKLPEDADNLNHPAVAEWMQRFAPFFENKEAWVVSEPFGICIAKRKDTSADEAAGRVLMGLGNIQV